MAKINLLTIHYGQCYGAVMQTYATCKLLERAGHDVTVINLINPKLKSKYTRLRSLKDIVREFKFWRFKNKYFSKLTNKAYYVKDLKLPKADFYIVGSDQVWNKDITELFGFNFYLDFVKGVSKIAFCSSFGKSEWLENPEYTEKVKYYLNSFKALSLREETGCKILKEVLNFESTCLMDPTLEYGCFDHFVTNKVQKKQIFKFLFSAKDEIVSTIVKDKGLPLLVRKKLDNAVNTGPIDWLTDIYQSQLVITDSFHGLALSILFKKEFIVLCADEMKFTRLYSLLKLLNLENRYVKSLEDYILRKKDLLEPINYKEVDLILTAEREKCYKFIETYINK